LGAVLAASALLKLRSPESSRAGLATFGIEGRRTTTVVWAALIAIELALAVTVAAGSHLAAWCAAALMLMFAATMVSALARGKAGSPCACFGAGSTVGAAAILRNLLLAAGFAALPLILST
jgi:hypothetical protein